MVRAQDLRGKISSNVNVNIKISLSDLSELIHKINIGSNAK